MDDLKLLANVSNGSGPPGWACVFFHHQWMRLSGLDILGDRASRLKKSLSDKWNRIGFQNTIAPNHQFTMKVFFVACLWLSGVPKAPQAQEQLESGLARLRIVLKHLVPCHLHSTTWGLYEDKTSVVVLLVGHKHPLCLIVACTCHCIYDIWCTNCQKQYIFIGYPGFHCGIYFCPLKKVFCFKWNVWSHTAGSMEVDALIHWFTATKGVKNRRIWARLSAKSQVHSIV